MNQTSTGDVPSRRKTFSVVSFLVAVSFFVCVVLDSAVAGPDTEYKLQIGDVVHVQVLNPGFETMSTDMVVQPDGKIKLPVKTGAVVQASGMTLTQFEAVSQSAFSGFIHHASIVVTVKDVVTPVVYLLGAFFKDGAYPIQGKLRAVDAVALGGGSPLGDLAQVSFTRGQVTRTLDLDAAQRNADSPDNVELSPQDVLFVPEMRKHITVEGQVTTPKNLDFKKNMVLEEAIAAAGGPTEKADIQHVSIGHVDGTSSEVDLDRLPSAKSASFVLKPDDIIIIPELRAHFTVQGQVAFPKNIPFRSRTTLDEVIAAAGGTTDKADLAQVTIWHFAGPPDVIDLDSLRQTNGRDVILKAGDVVNVPELRAHITVQGMVTTPRNIPYKRDTGLQEAIAAAGGPTDKADLSRVLVTHEDGTQLPPIDFEKLTRIAGSEKIVLRPNDMVTVPELRDRILVVGEVVRPEPIPYRSDLTLDAAIALAGGETGHADLGHVKVARMNPPGVTTVDLLLARQNGKATDVSLQPGDVVTIPELNQQVFVVGQVVRPGPVPYRPNMTLLEALSGPGDALNPQFQGAGGPTLRADLYNSTLTHADGHRVEIDLYRLIKDGDESLNVRLMPGDTLYLPESKHRIWVLGAVRSPGEYVMVDKGKMKLLDAVNLAGGTTDNANLKQSVIITGTAEKPVAAPAHLDRILRGGQLEYNVDVRPNTVVYVPQYGAGQHVDLNAILAPLLYVLLPRL